MKEFKLAKSIAATLAVIAFTLPAVVSADELKGRSEKVVYSDLDIVKENGAKALYRRLQSASKRVCGIQSIQAAGNIRLIQEQRDCYQNALNKAVAKIDSPTLTAIHES